MSSSAEQVALELLDSTLSLFKLNNIVGAMEKLQLGLTAIRRSVDPKMWKQICALCRSHPVSESIYQDPFTKWAYDKPRGFSGDSNLLDFIYQDDTVQHYLTEASDLGRKIYEYTSATPAPVAVRFRLNLLAQMIDELADKTPSSQILSVGCGHLREAQRAHAVREGRIGKFVAVDQDSIALAVVAKELSKYSVEPVQASLREFLKGQRYLGQFDFVYATGLYDYLPTSLAQRLTPYMFSMLRPGGSLLIPNFMPDILDAGYMEAFMDWRLVYRTPEEMLLLATEIPVGERVQKCTFVESGKNIVFLIISKDEPTESFPRRSRNLSIASPQSMG